jgi:hypothetical protein
MPGGVVAAIRLHGRRLCGECVQGWQEWERHAFLAFMESDRLDSDDEVP